MPHRDYLNYKREDNMAIKTEKEYRERVDKLRPNLFFGGKKVENLNDHPISKGVIEATARVYELTTDPEYTDTMTATSHLTGEPISRALHIHQSKEDLFKRLDMARLSSQKLGTCNYRCPGNEMMPSLAATTWEIDQIGRAS